jgi:hypothetical protein
VWVICSRNCLQKSGLHYQQSLHRYSWMQCKCYGKNYPQKLTRVLRIVTK